MLFKYEYKMYDRFVFVRYVYEFTLNIKFLKLYNSH